MLKIITKRMAKKMFLKYLGLYIIRICRLIFPISVTTFVIYLILENLKIGLISNYFDLNLLLFLAILSGIFLIFFDQQRDRAHYSAIRLIAILVITLLAMVLSYQYLQELGKMRYFISPIVGLILYIILYIYPNKND